MIHTWIITKTNAAEIRFEDESSLDAITRQLPEGWYSTFRTYSSCTRVIGLSAHLKRLPHADAPSLRRSLLQLLEPYRPGEVRVRVMETNQAQFYISVESLFLLPGALYENGARVETTSLYRQNPRVKSSAFISASSEERKYIAQSGIDEALLVKNGRILEGMTSNFFYVIQQADGPRRLCTAGRGILPGVTRTMVIRAARGRGVEVGYRALKLDQLPALHEAFITSSSRGILPVTQIDHVLVGQGSVGETTKMLMQAYNEYVLAHAEKIA